MPNDKAGLGLLIIGGLALWGLSRAKPEEIREKIIPIFPPPKPPVIPPIKPLLTTKAEVERVTGERVVDVYDYNRLNPDNPIDITPQTTLVDSMITNPSGSIEKAMELATKTGTPTYIVSGGYFIDADGKYIKGVGW